MKIVIVADPRAAAVVAADLVEGLVDRTPNAVLGVATGSSPLGCYTELAARVRAGLDMSAVTVFALDEYVGLAPDDPRSYTRWIRDVVAEPLGLHADNVHVPQGIGEDLDAACRAYEAAISAAGGVDLQILGIGRNGHLGFNEPASSLVSRTRVAALAQMTRTDNARFFGHPDDVPVSCVTQGLGTIMQARVAVLIATGPAKAPAIARAVEGPVSAFCPASVLQQHRDAVVILDEEAAAELTLADDYRAAARLMPSA